VARRSAVTTTLSSTPGVSGSPGDAGPDGSADGTGIATGGAGEGAAAVDGAPGSRAAGGRGEAGAPGPTAGGTPSGDDVDVETGEVASAGGASPVPPSTPPGAGETVPPSLSSASAAVARADSRPRSVKVTAKVRGRRGRLGGRLIQLRAEVCRGLGSGMADTRAGIGLGLIDLLFSIGRDLTCLARCGGR